MMCGLGTYNVDFFLAIWCAIQMLFHMYIHIHVYVHCTYISYWLYVRTVLKLLLALKSSEFLNGEVTCVCLFWYTTVGFQVFLHTIFKHLSTKSVPVSPSHSPLAIKIFVGPFLTSKAIHVHVVECHFHMQFMTNRGFCLCSHGSLKLNVLQFEKSNYHIRRSMHVHRYSKFSF